jgi:hypothetical protein
VTQEKLIKAADAACPFQGTERRVWLAAVRMLVRHGAVLCPKVTSVRFPVRVSDAQRIINRAVVRVRLLLDRGTKVGEDVAIEEAGRDGTLAHKVYAMR